MKKSFILFFLLFLAFPLRFYSEEEESLDLIYQKIRSLEQEIATLRNFIEENSYLIERYQEIQQQRYLDLDKRLHNILSGELEEHSEQSINLNELISTDELDLYKEALELFDVSRYLIGSTINFSSSKDDNGGSGYIGSILSESKIRIPKRVCAPIKTCIPLALHIS